MGSCASFSQTLQDGIRRNQGRFLAVLGKLRLIEGMKVNAEYATNVQHPRAVEVPYVSRN